MDREIVGLGTYFSELNIKGFSEYEFATNISLLEYDAVVINAELLPEQYSNEKDYYNNKRLLTKHDSFQIKEDYNKINKQLSELLCQGKNIFVIVGKNEDCYVYTGTKQFSGTGRNTQTINMVEPFDANSFLPVKLEATYITGENIYPCEKQPFSSFFQTAKKGMYYSAYLEIDGQQPIAKILGSEKVVASVVNYENGKIICLPSAYEDAEYTTKKEWKMHGSAYVNGIIELNNALRVSGNDFILPAWSEKYLILSEKNEVARHIRAKTKLQQAIETLKKQESILKSIQKYKALITSSGTHLEEIVKTVLGELGFVISETEKGRSDIIAKINDTDVVFEIKGVTKSAAEKHAAQLEKWVSHFGEQNGRTPKAILIVNAFCNLPLNERNEEAFPNQMLKYSELRGHCLLSTIQLLCLYIDIKCTPDDAKKKLEGLLSCVGKYVYYTNYEQYIKPNE